MALTQSILQVLGYICSGSSWTSSCKISQYCMSTHLMPFIWFDQNSSNSVLSHHKIILFYFKMVDSAFILQLSFKISDVLLIFLFASFDSWQKKKVQKRLLGSLAVSIVERCWISELQMILIVLHLNYFNAGLVFPLFCQLWLSLPHLSLARLPSDFHSRPPLYRSAMCG